MCSIGTVRSVMRMGAADQLIFSMIRINAVPPEAKSRVGGGGLYFEMPWEGPSHKYGRRVAHFWHSQDA